MPTKSEEARQRRLKKEEEKRKAQDGAKSELNEGDDKWFKDWFEREFGSKKR